MFSGILITVGAVIDEAQNNSYIHIKPCAKARDILVLKWVLIGFLLTISYKAVLLSNIMHIEYEKGLDTVDDVLNSEKPVIVDGTTGMINLLKTDPRQKYQQINKQVKTFTPEKGLPPMWVIER